MPAFVNHNIQPRPPLPPISSFTNCQKYSFGTFYDGTGLEGIGWSMRASPAYIAVCGALMSQYTLTGFDASAHLSEETRQADWSAPIGVVSSVGFSAIFGFFVLMALLFSIQNFDDTLNNEYAQPVLKILVDVFGDNGALAVFSVIMGGFSRRHRSAPDSHVPTC